MEWLYTTLMKGKQMYTVENSFERGWGAEFRIFYSMAEIFNLSKHTNYAQNLLFTDKNREVQPLQNIEN